MSHFDYTILNAIPHPALMGEEGRVVCCNDAAKAAFENLAPGCLIPEVLTLQRVGAGFVMAGGRGWHCTACATEGGTLFLLYPARLEGLSHSQLEGTLRRLREQMGHLMLSVQRLSRSAQEQTVPGLAAMNRSLCQMLRLTEHLDLLRDLEEDAAPFCPVTLDLAGLCREVCAAAGSLLELAQVGLRFESALSSLLVRGDSDLLQRMLLELLSNGARAAGAGGRLTVSLSLSRANDRAVLTFTGGGRLDDGRPLPHLLSGSAPDHRIPQPGEGAGLGLALVQRIVSLHQGALMMERRDGVTVTVALPLAKRGASLPVRTRVREYGGGLSPALVGLSDLLPDAAFVRMDEE